MTAVGKLFEWCTSNNDYLSNALDLQFCTNSVKYMEVTVRQIPEFQYEIYDLFYQGTSRTSISIIMVQSYMKLELLKLEMTSAFRLIFLVLIKVYKN